MKKNWLITQAQIAAGDIDSAIIAVDPEQLADAEIYGLAGAVRLRVEGAFGPEDLCCNPAARSFFRNLHQRWPWASYFLRLKPITGHSSLNEIRDISLFMALALCHENELTYLRTSAAATLRFNGDQLAAHFMDLQERAAQLGEAAGYSADQIHRRHDLVLRSVRSFFTVGRAVHRKPNQ